MEFRDAVDAFGAACPDRRLPILTRCCLGGIVVLDWLSVSVVVAPNLGERLWGSATKAAASCKMQVSSHS